MTIHVFSKAIPGNFPSGSVYTPNLYTEILQAGLTNLSIIEEGSGSNSDLVVVTFSVALTGTQPIELSGVIDSHVGLFSSSEGFPISGAVKGLYYQDDLIPGYRILKSFLTGASTSPSVTDDEGKGFEVGSRWINTSTQREFVLVDSTISGANWKETTISGGTGASGDFLLVDGTKPMSGNLDMGLNSIVNVNLVDGVDVSAHAARHLPGGVDPLNTTVPVDIGTVNLEGTTGSFSRGDHQHAFPDPFPGDIVVSGNLVVSGTVTDRRDFGPLPNNPPTGSYFDGDKYYNTTINEAMRYDASRGKWLSVASFTVQAGRNGGTRQGSFYRATNNMAMTVSRGYSLPRGTIVFLSKTRTDVDEAVLEVVSSSSLGVLVPSFLSSSAIDVSDEAADGDFEKGVISFRNKAGLNRTSNVQIIMTFKRRA